MFTHRFTDALSYAAQLHREQARKSAPFAHGRPMGSGHVPYVGHLIGVASIVIDAYGSEEEAIAALLHDAAEDQGGEPRLREIADHFGATVARIVRGCSDSFTLDPERIPPWRERKERYIAHLRESDDRSVYLVSAADKCHNARATARDLAFAQDPREVWSKFNPAAGPGGTLWYYGALLQAYREGAPDERRDLIVSDLSQCLSELRYWIELQNGPIDDGGSPF